MAADAILGHFLWNNNNKWEEGVTVKCQGCAIRSRCGLAVVYLKIYYLTVEGDFAKFGNQGFLGLIVAALII